MVETERKTDESWAAWFFQRNWLPVLREIGTPPNEQRKNSPPLVGR